MELRARARLRVIETTEVYQDNDALAVTRKVARFSFVDDQNVASKFWTESPTGDFWFVIDNPSLLNAMKAGMQFEIVLTEAADSPVKGV